MIVSSFFEMTEFEIFGLQVLKSRALWRPIQESYFSGPAEGLTFELPITQIVKPHGQLAHPAKSSTFRKERPSTPMEMSPH